ncbi:MAG: hypothetical protein JO272_01775 [Pseudonocardiales bacterium]|nr:hypothetical protein [Pseudonocardiales bacterium]
MAPEPDCFSASVAAQPGTREPGSPASQAPPRLADDPGKGSCGASGTSAACFGPGSASRVRSTTAEPGAQHAAVRAPSGSVNTLIQD